jgi:fumarate hydratase class I
MRHFSLKGVIGKGGMGAKTLQACQKRGRVPACHRRGGFADRPDGGQGAGRLQLEFGVPEAMWDIQ